MKMVFVKDLYSRLAGKFNFQTLYDVCLRDSLSFPAYFAMIIIYWLPSASLNV